MVLSPKRVPKFGNIFCKLLTPHMVMLSLVEHSLGVRGVGSSNLPVPTIIAFSYFHIYFSGLKKIQLPYYS